VDDPAFRHVVVDEVPPQNPHVKATGDVNGDGVDEAVVASSAGGPLVWYDLRTRQRHEVCGSGEWSCDAVLTDMDGDGDVDLVISEWYGQNVLEWFENPLPDGDPAAGPWPRHTIGPPRAHDLCVRDVDADGELEIAARDQGREGDLVRLYKRAGGRWRHRTIECPAGEGLALGDLTGDGLLDIVIGGRWYENPGDVSGGDWRAHTFAEWPEDAVVRVADMDGDGRLDVVLTRSEGPHRVSWFEAPDDPRRGSWPEHVIADDVDFAHGLVVLDLTGDGQPDVVVAEMHQSERRRVMAFTNEGGSRAWRRHVLSVAGSHNICAADLGPQGTAIVGANWSGPHQPFEMWLTASSAAAAR
jgi:hypothetical protein